MATGRHSRRQKKAAQKAANRAARAVDKNRVRSPDIFGLSREHRILRSNVRYIFTPHTPISSQKLLFGRGEEVGKIIQTLNTPGQHILLYGERGVGKSSLANVASELISEGLGLKRYVKRCDQSDTFETIMQEPLAEVGAENVLTELSITDKDAGKVEAKASGLKVNFEGGTDTAQKYTTFRGISPSVVAKYIGSLNGVLVIDEADAISKSEDRRRIAELIKQLSDMNARFKVMVVGIAQTGSELTDAHPSVQRCLKETKVRRMKADELAEIIQSGGAALRISFDIPVTKSIVGISSGYPHFTHLLALKCAEDAIGEGRMSVNKEHLKDAMRRSVEDAEGTLKRSYDDSVRSNSTAAADQYRYILMAAADLGSEEFSNSELRVRIREISGADISQGSLNNYFQRLVSSDGSAILRRTAHGVYRFEDPRMPSYVKIVNQMT